MFKQVKSIVFWSYLYKFRRKLTIVVLLFSVIILSQWIYSDIVEYLTLIKRTQYLTIILPLKWIIIFLNIATCAYLILSLFKIQKTDEPKIKETKPSDKQKVTQIGLSEREREFMYKKIRTEAEIILSKKIKENRSKG